MKAGLNRFAMTATAAAILAAASAPSFGFGVQAAGEANLVPFVLLDSNPLNATEESLESFLGINTVVKLTIPSAVGGDDVPNIYTAPWTTPTNGVYPVNPGAQLPAQFVGTKTIHWYFMSKNSVHVADGTFEVTPDDVFVFDWSQVARQQGIDTSPDVNGAPGYLVFIDGSSDPVTGNSARAGTSASTFAFFAEAWMFMGLEVASVTDGNITGVLGLFSANIPVLPMSDGVDGPIGAPPDLLNQVVMRGTNATPRVSPLVSGMRTNWSDGDKTDVKVVDVTLGNRSVTIANQTNFFQFPTLVVVWNDRNADGKPGPGAVSWKSVAVDIFNDDEESCSSQVDLSNEVNTIWVQSKVTYDDPDFYPVPRFVSQNLLGCVPAVVDNDSNLSNLNRLLSGGFMKFHLPEPVDTQKYSAESSAVFFSIPLQYEVTLEQDPVGGGTVLAGVSLIPFATALGHDRGTFKQ